MRKLLSRSFGLPRRIWLNLSGDRRHRWTLAIGYSFGALGTVYSILALLYDLNIDLASFLRMPFDRLFFERVLPFLAHPLAYVGIQLGRTGEALVALSGIGGSVLSNAEFRSGRRLWRHVVFGEPAFRIDLSAWDKKPRRPDPPAHTVLSRLAVYGSALLLAYSLLGLVPFTIFLPVGFYFFLRDVRYLLGWALADVLYAGQLLLAPYERWGEDEYWGTKWFLAFYDRRNALDDWLDRYYREFWLLDYPGQEHWTAAKRTLRDGARVIALALWLSAIGIGLRVLGGVAFGGS